MITPRLPGSTSAVLNKRSRNTGALISKEDRRSWLKIECARGRKARECYEGLQEACGKRHYRTIH